MEYLLDTAIRNNWALLTVNDYLEAFCEKFGFRPNKARIRKMIASEQIDVVRVNKKVYIVANYKSMEGIKPKPQDEVPYRNKRSKIVRYKTIKELEDEGEQGVSYRYGLV